MKFDCRVHRTAVRFCVIKRVAKHLGLRCGDLVYVRIRDRQTKALLYRGIQQLRSGTEIYGSTMRQCLSRGQWISIDVRSPR